MRIAFIVLLALLPACTPDRFVRQADPAPVVLTEKCIKAEDIPVVPPTLARADGTMVQDAAAASADARRLRDVANEQAALLRRCAQ